MSVRPFNISATLRFSEQDMQERAFLDSVTDRMYQLMLEVANHHAYSIAAPELFLVPIVHIKKFCKACTNIRYSTMFKQFAVKLEEAAQFIAQEREGVSFGVNDTKEIEKWEESMKAAGRSPLTPFYTKFVKISNKNKDALRLAEKKSNSAANTHLEKSFGGSKFSEKHNKGKKSPMNVSGEKKNFTRKQSGGNKFSGKKKQFGSVKRK